MNPTKEKPHVIVSTGDLFDKATIRNNTLLKTIKIVEQAALANKDIVYVFIAGNHDVFKDSSLVSSFEIFKQYFEKNKQPNLYVLTNEFVLNYPKYCVDLYFYPYDPFNKIPSILPDHKSLVKNTYVAFGHWEVEDFDNITGTTKYNSNLIPLSIKESFNTIITGHIHKPKEYKDTGVSIILTGSMQPYAFGEELLTETLYLTKSLSEVKDLLTKDKDVFANTNLRVLVKYDDEFLDELPNCLSLSYKYLDKQNIAKNEKTSEDTEVSRK